MKVEVTNNTGRYAYTASFDLSEEQQQAVLREGITRLLQGGTLGKWEKAVAYPGDKQKRPEKNAEGEKWSRKDIPFTPQGVEQMKNLFDKVSVELGRNEKDEAIVSTLSLAGFSAEEYDGAEKAQPKYKAEKDLLALYLFEADGKTPRTLKSGEPRSIESFCASRGIEEPEDSEAYAEDTAFLARVKEWQKQQAASQD